MNLRPAGSRFVRDETHAPTDRPLFAANDPDQVRRYAIEGSRLTLSTPPIDVGGRRLTSVLIWERVR